MFQRRASLARRTCALSLVTVLTASGCALAGSSTDTPDGKRAAAVPVATEKIEWSVGPDSLNIPGATTKELSNNDPSAPVFLLWPEIPGANKLNETLSEWASQRSKKFLADKPARPDSPAELSGFAVPVLADGTLLGVRAQSQDVTETDTAVSHRIWYADAASGQVWTSPELLTDEGRKEATKLASEHLKKTGEKSTAGKTTPEQMLGDIWFAKNGDLVMTPGLEPSASLEEETEPITIPRDKAEKLLSDKGRTIRDAAGRPSTYARVNSADQSKPAEKPNSPSPSPSPSTTKSYPQVDCATAKCVALTFDDGPSPETEKILDSLSSANVPATFYMLGQSVPRAPQTVRRAVSLGMSVGNHTWSHRNLALLSPDQQRNELKRAEDALTPLLGKKPTTMRPPYGSYNPTTRSLGYPIMMWDVDTEDWKNRSVATTTKRALDGAKPGSIILMHDTRPSTSEAVPKIIEGLKARGFTLVTVEQLLGTPAPGKAYFSRSNIR
ncbi:Peptidoglycan/xylan/chitin deacetylase, PgdA/CDA1 family [Austwickia chelonae]|uniref:Putative polysaccharide deacetylase n=1 Tax=Austwickia chelonae NBRC 105200 TaxID=1184607 RepID=K6W9W1_9MICO|nr:polysaccharide deacetylase family protein [Austwickia chelonae]GAB78617.1 putative polysaccharide deacetylase [Austwickia chelonae NBRC 105200]SEW34161.1 Peptidoglycan/xylan/chitin deacetylase, PgdA/CDA1 family [Austwickia chelonae]